jgi:thiosulfate sulfurtransferase
MTEIPQIDIQKAKELLDNDEATFIDLRDPNAHAQASIPGAQHIGDHNIEDFVKSADHERPVVVYCYHGNMSKGGTAYLLNNGFTQVWSMAGGFEQWRGVYGSGAE